MVGSAYEIAAHAVEALENAIAAEKRGDTTAAATFRAQAEDLRKRLLLTPARSRTERLAHVVIAKHPLDELVLGLVPAIAELGPDRQARGILDLFERSEGEDEGEDDEGGEFC